MNKFLLVVNQDKDVNLFTTNMVKQCLENKGGFCSIVDGYLFSKKNRTEIMEVLGDTEAILVLGGDGTLLNVAGKILDIEIPLFGINLGTVGFLTEGELSNLDIIAQRLLKNEFTIENRMMLSGIVKKADGTIKNKTALNDIVISRAGFSRLIALNVIVNGQILDTYEADGALVATPTGSTGYNLSAGGPIVSPQASLMVVTPVSPHSLTSKSIVLPSDDQIFIEILKKRKTQETEAIVSFDGGEGVELSAGDTVEIKKSSSITQLIKINNYNFYEILRNKLGGN